MKNIYLYIASLLLFLGKESISGQEALTNAFNDLQRSGVVSELISEMSTPCTDEALDRLLREKPANGYFCFTEDRLADIRMHNIIPQKWALRPIKERTVFNGTCQPGEFYTWQIGIFAPYEEIKGLTLEFSTLKNKKGDLIGSEAFSCFNMEGKDKNGNSFKKQIDLAKGGVQPLWIGIDIPVGSKGIYTGKVNIKVPGKKTVSITLNLEIEGTILTDSGDDEGWRKSRLRWLNLQSGNQEVITSPYIPVTLNKDTVHYLGGWMKLASTGLPGQIVTRYDQDLQISEKIRNHVLAEEIQFVIETEKGVERFENSKIKIISQTSVAINWEAILKNDFFEINCQGTFEFDGCVLMKLKVTSLQDIEVSDIRLEIPYTNTSSRYMMGLGQKGGYLPEEGVSWKWNIEKHQDKIWIGNINAGLNFTFKDENYERPLVNIYYELGKLNLPKSWGNDNKGGIEVHSSKQNTVILNAYSSNRQMKKGETLHYHFDMLITPVKPINPVRHFSERFYHSNSDLSTEYIEQALTHGANIINLHSKKDIYPFINYPYYDESIEDLSRFINNAHQKSIKTRVYYTTRELTIKIPEIWALKSLGNEIIYKGPGKKTRTLIHPDGPHEWLIQNMGEHFIPAWYNAFEEGKYKGDMDLSVITTPDSRWNNYYLCGLDWMVKKLRIDGIYIDDSALDRITLQRARRILDADGKRRVIDIHSWNHMNKWAGYANSLHIYTDLLPYTDRIWIGEGFTADNPIDFWLVEMSGIPFGLMSETLDAHNLYRGLSFGMLPRLPWSGNPVAIWNLFDTYLSSGFRLCGFWNDLNPFQTGNKELSATLFKDTDKAIVIIANWSDQTQAGNLSIDADELGFTPSDIYLPEIDNLQEKKSFDNTYPFTIQGREGLIICLEK